MFEGSRTIALVDLQGRLEKLFESDIDECDLAWRDAEGDMIPVINEQDFRLAMKHIGQGQVAKFTLVPKDTENKGKKPTLMLIGYVQVVCKSCASPYEFKSKSFEVLCK